MSGLTHFGSDGRPVMVDISEKNTTERVAVASGSISMSEAAYKLASKRDGKKGDPIAVAELAGIMAAKRTADIIPLCHPLPLTNVTVHISAGDERSFKIIAKAKTTGKTGVEMEALMAASAACLTLYDMLKAVDKCMVIGEIKLLEKSGGSSGYFTREAE